MLYESGDVSEQQLDADRAVLEQREADYQSRLANLKGVEANVEAARARVAVSRAEVSRAQENVDFTVIRSPIDGVITRVDAREGEVALGTIQNVGSTIMVIADLSEMLVMAEIPETDVNRIEEGQAARVAINGFSDERFDGTLRKMSLESQAGSDGTNIFRAEIVLHLEERRMFAGLTANVDIEVETLDDLIVVPSQAVLDKRIDTLPKEIRDESKVLDMERTFAQVVFVRDEDSVARLRPVKVAASNLRETGISAGIKVGDEVIVGPFRNLQDLEHGEGVSLENTDEDQAQLADDEGEGEQSSEATTASTAG
jgi:HlyD family secretion protein